MSGQPTTRTRAKVPANNFPTSQQGGHHLAGVVRRIRPALLSLLQKLTPSITRKDC